LQVPRKVLLQVHALAHYNNSHSSDSPVDPCVFSFVAAYENPVLALQRDLERVSPRVGEVREDFTARFNILVGLLLCRHLQRDPESVQSKAGKVRGT
jgi:hypothetical protein